MTFATGKVQSSAARADPTRLIGANVATANTAALTRNLDMAVSSCFFGQLIVSPRKGICPSLGGGLHKALTKFSTDGSTSLSMHRKGRAIHYRRRIGTGF